MQYMAEIYKKVELIHEWLGVPFEGEETRKAIALMQEHQKLLFEGLERQQRPAACHGDN